MKAKYHLLLAVFLTILMVSSCTKKIATTPAKVKLSLSNIVNFSSGIGSGGAILFGKSSKGEQFGKILSSNEENLELPNGDWSFYSVMWSRVTSNMSDQVYCGKSTSKLSGTALTISMSLNNANCADAAFSDGDHYSYYTGGEYKNRFAQFFTEECDDLNQSSFTCMLSNQGSALSYRLVFRSYKRNGANGPFFGTDSLYGECVEASALHQNGLKVNFPTGSSAMPFVASVEMFLGSNDCGLTTPETKGVYTQTFTNGLGGQLPESKVVNNHGYNCLPLASSEITCNEYLGSWAGTCGFSGEASVVTNFSYGAYCDSAAAAPLITTPRYIKQMISIPKSFLCRFNDYMNTGAAAFPGGEGSGIRPYKICNEWQINQIGEDDSTLPNTYHYKLMNDLDMNRVTQGIYPVPHCAGVGSSDVHMNLNPLDGFLCGGSAVGYSGTFNGNGYTISNARISGEDFDQLGFVRELNAAGVVKDLNFKNLSVRGNGKVGGIVGALTDGTLSNIKIYGGDIEARSSNVGGAVGYSCNLGTTNSSIQDVHVMDMKIRGINDIGGFIGNACGTIQRSMFSGIVVGDNDPGVTSYSGGFAGGNTGTIESSYSEGYIGTKTTHIGGFVGGNWAPASINGVYSTMAMTSLKNTAGTVTVGGIAALHDSGASISDCFSDTRKNYFGIATIDYSGTVHPGGAGTVSKCYTDTTNFSSHQSATYDQLRDISYVSSNIFSGGAAFLDPGRWQMAATSGEIIRLAWEQRECLDSENLQSIAVQVSTYLRGSVTNPIIICTKNQLLDMNARSASEYYRLATDINLSSIGITSNIVDGVATFNGAFDGDGHALYGIKLDIDNVMDGVGIFRNISATGKISYLNLFANAFYTTADSVSNVGILSNNNTGDISHVKSYTSNVVSENYIGTLASQNFGTIRDVEVRDARLIAISYSGGIAGTNDGTIQRASSQVNMGATTPSSYHAFGAITGKNVGLVDQAIARGEIVLGDMTAGASHEVGGLVGYNSATVSNSYVDEHFRLYSGGTTGIGGAIGVMDGSGAILSTSFSLGQIYFTQAEWDLTADLDSVDDPSDLRVIGPLVGQNLNGAQVNDSLFLEHLILMGDGSDTIDYCSSDINLLTGSRTMDGIFYQHDILGPTPYTYISSGVITPDASYSSCAPSAPITFLKSYSNYAEYGTVTSINGFKTAANFSAFDLAVGDTSEVLNFHFSQMNGTGTPAGTPIWNLEAGEDYPDLLQVER